MRNKNSILAWKRNGFLGRLCIVRNKMLALSLTANSDIISQQDYLSLNNALDTIQNILHKWNKHYIKESNL